MFEEYLLLAVGFVILIKGADIFVESASNIASIFRVPIVIIGIMIIGFGTSLPELAVNLNAVLQGVNSIGIGAVIGANIFNVLVTIGGISLFKVIHIKGEMLKFEFPFLLIASALLLFTTLSYLLFDRAAELTRTEGIFFLVVFAIFLVLILKVALSRRKMMPEDHHHLSKSEELKVGGNLLSLFSGVVFIIYGGHLVVEESSKIALSYGLSKHFLGLTVVGIGAALPEFVTCIIAAAKNKQDLIIGNLIGSNIFNILCVLGLSSSIRGLALTHAMIIDSAFCLGTVLLLMFFAYCFKQISRWGGILFLSSYIIYFGYILVTH